VRSCGPADAVLGMNDLNRLYLGDASVAPSRVSDAL
jgi:hypothetical protein